MDRDSMDFDPTDPEPEDLEPAYLDPTALDIADPDAATFASGNLVYQLSGPLKAILVVASAIAVGVGAYCISVLAEKPSMGVGIIGAALVLAVAWVKPDERFGRCYRFVHVGRDSIMLMRRPFDQRIKVLQTQNVSLVVGEAGLSFEGGALLVWKRIVLTTPEGRYVMKFDDPNINAAAYHHVVWVCPRVVGVSATGELHVPQPPPGVHAMTWISEVAEIVRRELRRQVRKAALVSVAMLSCWALAATLLVIAFMQDIAAKPANVRRGPEALAKPLIFSGIGAVVSGVFALRRILHARRIRNALNELIDDALRKPHEPFAGTTIATAPSGDTNATGSSLWAWMGVAVCVLSMCVPILGVGLNLIVLVFAKNSTRVVRRIVIACLLISILLTAGLLFMAR